MACKQDDRIRDMALSEMFSSAFVALALAEGLREVSTLLNAGLLGLQGSKEITDDKGGGHDGGCEGIVGVHWTGLVFVATSIPYSCNCGGCGACGAVHEDGCWCVAC